MLRMSMNPKYVAGLKGKELRAQKRSIREGTVRPKVKGFRSRRSKWVKQFEERYGTKISDDKFTSKHIMSQKGIDKVLDKGRGAYYSSGSRPNQTPASWARARLASVIMGGPALKYDHKIAKRHGRKKWKKEVGLS